jgi:rubredoxin
MPDTNARLLTCPDCGGILESSRPAWIATIEVAASMTGADIGPENWYCPLCGYQPEATLSGPEPARSATRV